MAAVATLVEFQLRNALRSRWLALYTTALVLLTGLLFRFGSSAEQVVVSVLTVVVALTPLIGLLYGVLNTSQSREFLELMVAQPLQRHELFWGTFIGMVFPLTLVVPIGLGIPWALLVQSRWELYATLALGGALVSMMSAALGIAFALWWEERLYAVGVAFLLWFVLAVLYDGFVLLLGIVLHDYPVEYAMLLLMALNPLDLLRVATLLQLDAAALLGYTGALLQRLAGSAGGTLLAVAVLLLWSVFPTWLALRSFLRKDF
jgi:Cu-processing system permease protein